MDAVLRRRAGLPDPARRVRAARHQPRAPTRPPSSALATKVWEHARLAEATTEAVAQAHRRRRRRRPGRARHRRAAAERRRAVVRRLLGGHPGAPRRSTFDYRRPGDDRARSPATCSRGASCATPAAGTSSASTPTAARSGSSGSPAWSGRATAGRARPASYEVPPGTDVRATARRLAPAPADRARRSCWCARAPGTRCAATPSRVEPDVAGPDDRTALGPAVGCPQRGRPGRRAARLRRRRVRRGARRRCATTSWRRLRARWSGPR